MDWPRAKTILIGAFLALNAVLVVHLYLWPLFGPSARPLRPEAIKQLLAEQGIQVEASMPRRGPTSPFARFADPVYSDREITAIARRLLGASAARVPSGLMLNTETAASYRGDGGQLLVVSARGLISYENQAARSVTAFSAEEAAGKAAVFVREHVGGDDFVFKDVTPLDIGGYRVDYLQKFRASLVLPGYIRLIVTSEGVAAMWMHRLRVTLEAGTAKGILSAHEAVLSLANHRQNAGEQGNLVVQDIDFGFHSPIYDAADLTWRGVPVWRVRTSRGEFFINAHSGVLEAR